MDMSDDKLLELVVTRSHRVPVGATTRSGDGSAVTRQFDAVLMSAGFKMSGDLLSVLASRDPGEVMDLAVRVLPVVRKMSGAHSTHNVYFRDFPFGVPDTEEFWAGLFSQLVLAQGEQQAAEQVLSLTPGPDPQLMVSLLALPGYGTPQHGYAEMLAAHDSLVEAASDRVTMLDEGVSLHAEGRQLTQRLAGRNVPLSGADLEALVFLAGLYTDDLAAPVPVRENQAVINEARIRKGLPARVSSVTDVLRLAVQLSGGDVTLQQRTKFKSFPRSQRRAIMASLDSVVPLRVGAGYDALSQVHQHAEAWKRLGERIHPHEFPGMRSHDVFAVARGHLLASPVGARVMAQMQRSRIREAAEIMAPGQLFRSLDWLLRSCLDSTDIAAVLDRASESAGQVSGRVLLGAREHFENRRDHTSSPRIFANRRGTAWSLPDRRSRLGAVPRTAAIRMLDDAIGTRMETWLTRNPLVIEREMLGVALPLSGKTTPPGLGILPRGSVAPLTGLDTLSVFVHWAQAQQRTDYDLSTLLLDEQFGNAEHVSWTRYHGTGAVYSGDITSAPLPDGATEIISLTMRQVRHKVIIPQVHIYSGDDFAVAAESYFGFMERDGRQAGQPFEPRTVRAKSDMRGSGRVALPLMFLRGDDGKWRAKWVHLYLKGSPSFTGAGPANQLEGSKVTVSMLIRAMAERNYITVRYLAELAGSLGGTVVVQGEPFPVQLASGPVTYIGMQAPAGLPEGSILVTPRNLEDLIPS